MLNAFQSQFLFDICHFVVVTPAANFKSYFVQWVDFFLLRNFTLKRFN